MAREEILGRVWGIGTAGLETRTVDMHVARLRGKLRDPAGSDAPETILTVRSHGYMAGTHGRDKDGPESRRRDDPAPRAHDREINHARRKLAPHFRVKAEPGI